MYDLTKICNLCLSNLKLNQLFAEDSRNQSIDEAIHFVLPELIILQPENAVRVCSKCLSAISDFYDFKKMCLKNNATLWSSVNKSENTNDDETLLSTEIKIEEQTETDQITDTTTYNEAVTSSENSNYSPVPFEHKQIKCEDDDSDLEEIIFDPSVDSVGESSNFAECASLSKNEDSSVQNIEENSESMSYDTNNETVKKPTKINKCLECNKIFKHKGHLNVHMKTHLNIRDFECSICSKTFVKKESLKCHMYAHSDTKNFECPVCKKKFVQRCGMTKHLKKHTGYDKTYECTICSKIFTLKDSLERHLKMHDGIKKFECTICSRKFLQKIHLNEHIKIHTKTREYECSICNKKFIQSSTMKKHMKIHTGIKEFECSVCHKQFLRKDNLKSHMRRKHDITDVFV